MRLSVRDLLDLPVVQRARPEVLVGHDLASRDVRWVHTSEILDIGPLLKGGEVLLTTGLGLVGASAEAQRGYVRALAQRGLAALLFELGRSFPAAPEEIVAAAAHHNLPLVVLHAVVPFVEVTETVHQVIVAAEVERLRRTEQVNAELIDGLLFGTGLPALIGRIGNLAGCPALLRARDGRIVATTDAAGVDPGADAASVTCARTVEVFGTAWGDLVLVGREDADRATVLERGAVAVALELARTGSVDPALRGARRELVRDMARNTFRSAEELTARAEVVGFVPTAGRQLMAICFGVDAATPLARGVSAAVIAARHLFGMVLVGDVDRDIVVCAAVPRDVGGSLRRALQRLADAVDEELRLTTGGHVVAVTAGPGVDRLPELVRAISNARESSALARHLGWGVRVLLSADLGMHRLLARLVDDPELDRFIDEQLGALLRHDARHGRDMLPTLEAHLANGLSKTATAAALGLRRQTVYGRLERIEALLGEPHLAERRTALDLAILAWRLRSAGAGRHRALLNRPEG